MRLLSRIIPKNFVSFTTSIFVLSILMFNGVAFVIVLFPKIMTCVFLRFNERRLVCSHVTSNGMSWLILFSSSGMDLPTATKFESSANKNVWKFLKMVPRS